MTVMSHVLLSVWTAIAFVLGAGTLHAQQRLVFVGMAGSRCEFSTVLADRTHPDPFVTDKKYWAHGFLEGAYATLGMEPVRSSVDFVYARLQNYCAQHRETTLRDAMLALLAEDRPTAAGQTPEVAGARGTPPVVYRPPVFRLDPPTWVLWTRSVDTDWHILNAEAVDFPSTASVNLSYFETLTDCTSVRSWLTGLPKSAAMSRVDIFFQCFPSNFDPRGRK